MSCTYLHLSAGSQDIPALHVNSRLSVTFLYYNGLHLFAISICGRQSNTIQPSLLVD